MILCVPASFILAVVGIAVDRKKWLAILVALVAGGLIALALRGFTIC